MGADTTQELIRSTQPRVLRGAQKAYPPTRPDDTVCIVGDSDGGMDSLAG
jgi:hypothetical protein